MSRAAGRRDSGKSLRWTCCYEFSNSDRCIVVYVVAITQSITRKVLNRQHIPNIGPLTPSL